MVGSFDRYSWPATAGIVALGVAVVALGWRGPLHHGLTDTPSSARPPQPTHAPPHTPPPPPAHAPLPTTGTALWGGLFVAGCLWELAALLEQPTLATSSYAHPTVSTLTDPVLASSTGRWAVVAGWLALGWYLVER